MRRFRLILSATALVLMGALTASAETVTLEQALQVVKRQFQDSKVDYFLVDNNNATAWNIFVDMEPTKGWSHRCCVASLRAKKHREQCQP